MVNKGCEYYSFNHRQHKIDHNWYLLVNPDAKIRVSIRDEGITEGLCLYFSTDFIGQLTHTLCTDSEKLIDNIDRPASLLMKWTDFPSKLISGKLHSVLFDILNTADHALTEKSSLLPNFNLINVAEEIIRTSDEIRKNIAKLPHIRNSVRQEVYLRLQKAVSLILSDYHKPLTIDNMASEATLSVFHFSRLFKSVYACSPGKYLMDVRIREASNLLRSAENKIADIALKTGFHDISSFSRSFRMYTGKTPSSYRISKI